MRVPNSISGANSQSCTRLEITIRFATNILWHLHHGSIFPYPSPRAPHPLFSRPLMCQHSRKMSESTYYPQYQRQIWAEYRISQIPAPLTRPIPSCVSVTHGHFVIHERQTGSLGFRPTRPVEHCDVIALNI